MIARLGQGLLTLVFAVAAFEASAQDPYALRTAVGSEAYLWELRANQAAKRSNGTPQPHTAATNRIPGRFTPAPASTMTNQTRNALNYWGGRRADATLNQMPRRPSFVQPASANLPATGSSSGPAKPFAGANPSGTPTVSPYLQLFREEFEEAAPNYHAFVRPELERQKERNRQRRDALQPRPAARPSTASTPNAGVHSSRFGNTGSFYGGWQR